MGYGSRHNRQGGTLIVNNFNVNIKKGVGRILSLFRMSKIFVQLYIILRFIYYRLTHLIGGVPSSRDDQ